MQVVNAAIGHGREWQQDGATFKEMIRQEYAGNNCVFSAGTIEGLPPEQVYLMWEKDGEGPHQLYLTNDEMAAIAWVTSGTLWAVLYGQRDGEDQ